MSDRAREILVLAFVAVSALAFVYPIDWQDVSRLGLTQSVAIRGSLRIDPYASQTGDKALYAGHYYSDKAPGLSFAALPAFEGVRELGGVGRAERQNGVWNRLGLLWLMRVATGGLFFLLAVWLVGRAAERVSSGTAAAAAATFGLSTLAMPLAAVTFSHVAAGAVAFAAFLLAWTAAEHQDRALRVGLAAGVLSGIGILLEYPAAIIATLVLTYLAAKTRRARLPTLFCVGLLPSLVALAIYNDRAFGSPWHLSYRYSAFEQQTRGFFGFAYPTTHGLWQALFAAKGLVTGSPVVLLAAVGLFLTWRRGWKLEATICAAVTLSFIIYDAGYYMPYGGTSPGPRFIVPALPFLSLGLGPVYQRWPRLFSVVAFLSAASMIHVTATWNELPDWTFTTIWSRWGGVPHLAGAALVCATALIALGLAFGRRRRQVVTCQRGFRLR